MFDLLRRIRLYAGRCPHCGTRLWQYGWQDSPLPVPVLTVVAVCPQRHFARTELNVQGREVHLLDEGGKALLALANVELVPPTGEKPIHGKDIVVRTRSAKTVAALEEAKADAARAAKKAAEEKAAAAKAAAEKKAAEEKAAAEAAAQAPEAAPTSPSASPAEPPAQGG